VTIKPTPQSLARICLPLGALTIAAGAAQQNIALALGGFALVVTGLTAVAIHVIVSAIRDTAEERRRLQEARDEVEEDRTRCIALRAGVDADEERLCRLGVQMEHDTAEQLAAERAELMAELEDKRAAIKREGFVIGLNLNDRGVIANALQPRPDAKVIHLPVGTIGSAAGQGAYSPS